MKVVTRSRETLRLLQKGSPYNSNDSEGLKAFVARQNQEAAAQYSLAVMSYQTALKSGSDLVPSKVIGERLAAIQTTHPRDFDTGMERFLAPPLPRFDSGMRLPQPYYGQQPENRPQPSLLIPPAPISSPACCTRCARCARGDSDLNSDPGDLNWTFER